MSDDDQINRRTLLKATGAASAVGALGGVATASPVHDPGPKEDEVLVGVSATHDLVEAVVPSIPSDAAIVHENERLRYVSVKFPSRVPDVAKQHFIDGVTEREGVKYAERNETYETQYTPNDPRFGDQYAPQQVEADAAWDTTLGCSDSLVVVVDQGIQYDHPDLDDNMCVIASNHGRDVVDGDADPYPDAPQDEYHATHVAGNAIGGVDNGEGIAGIGNCPVCSCRALDESGQGSTADIADCIEWATNQGADVINLSLGGGGYTSTMKSAVSYAVTNGVLVVAAAGNDGSASVSYPAAFSECVAVSAVDSNENLASFSQYGSSVELCAPGVDVLSTTTQTRGSYEQLSGTSMAAPIVSGVACLANCQWNLTNSELRSHLKNTAKGLGLSSDEQGAGQVNALNAVTVQPGNGGGGGGGGGGNSTSGTISGSLDNPYDYADYTWAWNYSSPSQVVVELDGPSSADFDLYVNEGTTANATPSNYDYGSYSTNSQEQITITRPDTSTDLQIDVDSYSGSGSYTLTITEYK